MIIFNSDGLPENTLSYTLDKINNTTFNLTIENNETFEFRQFEDYYEVVKSWLLKRKNIAKILVCNKIAIFFQKKMFSTKVIKKEICPYLKFGHQKNTKV